MFNLLCLKIDSASYIIVQSQLEHSWTSYKPIKYIGTVIMYKAAVSDFATKKRIIEKDFAEEITD